MVYATAEIPDKESDEIGYDTVSMHMIHGPCGAYNIECPCMKDGKCTNIIRMNSKMKLQLTLMVM